MIRKNIVKAKDVFVYQLAQEVLYSFGCLLLSTLLGCFFLSSCQPQPFEKPAFNKDTIRVVMDNNYPPFTFLDDQGNLAGILIDQWKLWEQKTGIKVQIDAMDWGKAQKLMETGQYDVIDTIFYNETRARIYDFSKPYTKIEVPIFFHKSISGISDTNTLKGFLVAVKGGDAAIEYLKQRGVDQLVEYNSYESIIEAAKEQKVVVFVVDKPPALYFLYKRGIQDNYKSTLPLYTGEFHRAVLKGNTSLLKVVEEGFASISKAEYNAIDQKWYGTSIVPPEYLNYLGIAGLVVSGVILSLFLWTRALQSRVKQKTKDLVRVNQELALSEEKYRRLIENLPGAVYQYKKVGNKPIMVYISEEVEELTGYPAKEFIGERGRRFASIVHPYDFTETYKCISNNIDSGLDFQVEYRIITKQGREIWVSDRGRPSLGENREIIGVDGALFDITKRKTDQVLIQQQSNQLQAQNEELIAQGQALMEAQESLKQLNQNLEHMIVERTSQLVAANKELEAFSYSISHDLRSPLRHIDSFSNALIEDYRNALGPEGKDYLDRIRNGVRQMSLLIESLLKLSRISRSELQTMEVNLSLLAQEIMNNLKSTNSHRQVEFICSPSMIVKSDPSLIRAALINLLENAWKFTSKRLEARIEFGKINQKEKEVFFIRDNGAGFDMTYASKLFGAFQRLHNSTEFEGTGIGLAIVQRIIHRHGGQIWADSEVEKGTTFYFTLPNNPDERKTF